MAFTKEQRIQISRNIVEIPTLNAALDNVTANFDIELAKANEQDLGNKDLMDRITSKINGYQDEIKYLDGNVRTELIEQDLLDSANKIKQNPFFPNDFETPLPNVPDGIWKFLLPFSGNKAIGLNYVEVFPSTIETEGEIISDISGLITSLEANPEYEKVTGQTCGVADNGTCSLPEYNNQVDCEDNGGTWTADLEAGYVAVDWLADFNLLKSRINDWKTILNNQKTEIQAVDALDDNPSRTAENAAAIADIDNAIAEIDSWIAIQDFDTTTMLPVLIEDCDPFYLLDEDDFDPAKLTTTVIQIIKDEITARTAFIPTRIAQVTGYLGSAGQDLTTGELDGSGSGFYDDRFKVINIRLNLLGGSLNKKRSLEKGKDAQGAIQATNNNKLDVYSTAIKVSKFRSKASNNGTVHVLSGADFSPGDSVYVMADDQEELSGTISSVDGDTLFLDFNVPEKYTDLNFARVYKVL